jgi:hypothetical protein
MIFFGKKKQKKMRSLKGLAPNQNMYPKFSSFFEKFGFLIFFSLWNKKNVKFTVSNFYLFILFFFFLQFLMEFIKVYVTVHSYNY